MFNLTIFLHQIFKQWLLSKLSTFCSTDCCFEIQKETKYQWSTPIRWVIQKDSTNCSFSAEQREESKRISSWNRNRQTMGMAVDAANVCCSEKMGSLKLGDLRSIWWCHFDINHDLILMQFISHFVDHWHCGWTLHSESWCCRMLSVPDFIALCLHSVIGNLRFLQIHKIM